VSRILGIDYGAKRTGLAISDPLNKYAIPLDVINSTRTYPHIKQLLLDEDIRTIIIGLAMPISGKPNAQVRSTVRIADRIRKLGVDVVFESEHLTSEAANDMVRRQVARSGVPIDDIAASVILQQYLNSKNSDS
jgi:putative Holliday junction resolvase